MTEISAAERERQRVEHLVLGRGRPRPEPEEPQPRRRKRRRIARLAQPAAPVVLAPGVEERVALRERWSHKAGTPETCEHVDAARRRPGSLARLYDSGAIDRDQVAAAASIGEAYRALTADVAVKTASFETRIDGGGHGRAEQRQLGRIHADLAYGWWRAALGVHADAMLAVIVHDVGLVIAARRHGLSVPRTRRMLVDALDLWPQARRGTRDEAQRQAGG